MSSFDSPYYPYEKPETGFNTLKGAELIPYKLITYLMDLPDKNNYQPIDDNSRPRVRFMKYLWYDEPNPLSKSLPTPTEKLSLLYNGENAMLATDEDKAKHPKGYRLMVQNYTMPSEIDARAFVKAGMGRIIPRSDFQTILGLSFEISINYALDNIMRTNVYSRGYALMQTIVESLHGVNIAGVGTVYFNKSIHGDCGYTTYHTEGTSWYGNLFMAIDWQESDADFGGVVTGYCE